MLPRVYPILDTATLDRHGIEPFSFCEALLEGGAKLVQFRHKGLFDRETVSLLERLAGLAKAAGATLIVNDRTDLAAVFGCGVHLGQTDLPPELARKVLPPPAIVGYSTHNSTQLAVAAGEPVDYVALGPIFGTSSKAKPDPVVGLDNLRSWRLLATKPLVAIGGITLETAAEVWRAGADSVAVISDLIQEDAALPAIRERMEQWLKLSSETL